MHWAARSGHGPVVEALLRGGQAPELPRVPGHSPTGAKGDTGPEREHVPEVNLTVFDHLSQERTSMRSSGVVEASVECHFPGDWDGPVGRSSSALPLVSHKGEEVGLLGPLGPLVRGMGGRLEQLRPWEVRDNPHPFPVPPPLCVFPTDS